MCLENKLRQMSLHSKRSQKARTQIRSHIVKTRNLFEFSSKSIITYWLVYQVLCRRPTEASPKTKLEYHIFVKFLDPSSSPLLFSHLLACVTSIMFLRYIYQFRILYLNQQTSYCLTTTHSSRLFYFMSLITRRRSE